MVWWLQTAVPPKSGHQMLSKFVDQFPRFYEAIQKCVQHTTTHHFTDYTAEDRTGLNFLPFSIFAFIDCSIDKVCRPYSGPDGDYIGAPRREEYYDAQESVYTGYKKYHGIKVETVLLPNGISTLYGPVSARPHDVAGVLQMSGLDEFLYDIQQDEEYVYSALGDGIYGQTGLRCECRYAFVLFLFSPCLYLYFTVSIPYRRSFILSSTTGSPAH